MDVGTYIDDRPTLTVTSQNPGCAVTVAQLKAQLRYDASGEDSLMATYIRATSEYIERISGHAILSRTYTQSFRCFAAGLTSLFNIQGFSIVQGSEIELLRYPVATINSVLYRDPSGAEQTLSPSVYALAQSKPSRLRLQVGQCYPMTDMSADSVRVNFTAGYTQATIPPELQQAIIFLSAHFFENRTPFIQISGMTEVPLTLKALIDSVKVFFAI